MTEYDEPFLNYQNVNHVIYFLKMKDDAGLQDEVKKVNTMPIQLAAFELSNSKRNMKNFIHVIKGFYTNDVFYTDTGSFYFENKHWSKLAKAGLIGKNTLQGKNNYKEEEFGVVSF